MLSYPCDQYYYYSNLKDITIKHVVITGISSSTANVGDTIAITGEGFWPDATRNRVCFTKPGGLIQQPVNSVSADGTSLYVDVPTGAISGFVYVEVESYLGTSLLLFPVLELILLFLPLQMSGILLLLLAMAFGRRLIRIGTRYYFRMVQEALSCRMCFL